MLNPTSENQNDEILRKVGLFTDIRDDARAMREISTMMKRRSFPQGHRLIEQGTVGSEFYVLISGSVTVAKLTPEGDAYKVAVLDHVGHPAFGEGGLMEGEVRSATIFCDTKSEFLVLSRSDFDLFCQNHPQYALPVFRRIAQSLISRLNQTANDLMLLHKALMDEIRNM